MGQSKPFRATALVVEDDPMQREMLCLLLEESEVNVIECESAEAAEAVLKRIGGSVALIRGQAAVRRPARWRKILVEALGRARRDPRGRTGGVSARHRWR